LTFLFLISFFGYLALLTFKFLPFPLAITVPRILKIKVKQKQQLELL